MDDMADDKVLLGTVKPSKPIAEMTAEERWAFSGELAAFFKHRLEVARDADEVES